MASQIDRVGASSAKWDSAHRIPDYRRRFLMSVPWARQFINNLYLGSEGSSFTILRNRARDAGVQNALELAGGRGDFALGLLKNGIAKELHLVDVSGEAVKIALQKAEDLGVAGLTASVGDVNTIEIEGKWDLVIFSQSLHHIEALEHVLQQVKKSLKPGGFLYVNDYIGPTRMQWTDMQLDLMNKLLSIIPEHMREELNIDGTVSNRIKRQISRIPLSVFEKVDPSEAVRSGEIATVLHSTFDSVEYYPLGGGISYELFRNIAHNFHDDDPFAKAVMRSILFFEHELTSANVLDPAFGTFICQ